MHFSNFPRKMKIYVVVLKKVLSKKVIRRRRWNNTFDPKKCHDFGQNIKVSWESPNTWHFFPPRTSLQSCSILISFGQGLTLFQFATKICIKYRTHGNYFFSNTCVFFSLFWPKAKIYLSSLLCLAHENMKNPPSKKGYFWKIAENLTTAKHSPVC